MKPILPKAFLLCNPLVNSICPGVVRHVLMEGRIEGGYVLDVWQLFHAALYYGDSRSIVSESG
jgi:hypothetical protein